MDDFGLRWEKRTSSVLPTAAPPEPSKYDKRPYNRRNPSHFLSLSVRRRINQCLAILFLLLIVYLGSGIYTRFTLIKKPPPGHDLPSLPTTRSNMCLVVPWEGPVPEYTRLWANSVRRNDPSLLRVYFFHHRRNNAAVPQWASTENSAKNNLVYIDLESVSPRYSSRGFRGFVAERLCAFHKRYSPKTTSTWQCAELELYLQKTNLYQNDLKGLIGLIYASWVNPAACDAWGFTDADLVFGDLDKFFSPKKNPLAWSADIFTVGPGDINRRYLHGQLTLHVYEPVVMEDPEEGPPARGALKKHPKPTMEMYHDFGNLAAYTEYLAFMHFQNCSTTATMKALRNDYSRDKYRATDEGCYSFAAHTGKGIRIVDFTKQSSDHKTVSVIYRNNNVYMCSQNLTDLCLPQLPPVAAPAPDYSSRKNIISTQHITRQRRKPDCMFWIAEEYSWCVLNMPWQWYPPRRQTVIVHYGDGRVEFRDYEGELDVNDESLTMKELALFHWQGWKKVMVPECPASDWKENSGVDRPPGKGWKGWVSWGEERLIDMNYICA
ncbi:hypothetical protein BJ742DRAFT_366884 [Cladochytrium replicatum]|nr:hypothetical protein BJ742DRAFT_366884 [Cladochytrium replicatum]